MKGFKELMGKYEIEEKFNECLPIVSQIRSYIIFRTN
jgi:hypothetical protein